MFHNRVKELLRIYRGLIVSNVEDYRHETNAYTRGR